MVDAKLLTELYYIDVNSQVDYEDHIELKEFQLKRRWETRFGSCLLIFYYLMCYFYLVCFIIKFDWLYLVCVIVKISAHILTCSLMKTKRP